MVPRSDDYCHTFDLSVHVPETVVQRALRADTLVYLRIDHNSAERSTFKILESLSESLLTQEANGSNPIRICIPSLGSPFWGRLTSQVIRSIEK